MSAIKKSAADQARIAKSVADTFFTEYRNKTPQRLKVCCTFLVPQHHSRLSIHFFLLLLADIGCIHWLHSTIYYLTSKFILIKVTTEKEQFSPNKSQKDSFLLILLLPQKNSPHSSGMPSLSAPSPSTPS